MFKYQLEKRELGSYDVVVDVGLGNSSYVIDQGDGGGLVVDPERDPRRCRCIVAMGRGR